MKTLAFENSSRRACQLCLAKLHRKGLVIRFDLHRGLIDGGGRSLIYALSLEGAEIVSELTGISVDEIPHEKDPQDIKAYLTNHQLTINRCLIALLAAAGETGDFELVRWNSDPHTRMRYQSGRGRRVIHPDAIARIDWNSFDRWFFFEIDKGTQEPRRCEQKVARYGQFYLSGTWRSEFPIFPEIRITTTHSSRVQQLVAATERAVTAFAPRDMVALKDNMYISVAAEKDFLAHPLARIWSPTFGEGGQQDPLLRSETRIS